MDNIIKANIKMQNTTTYTCSAWQYDYGQILQITGAELPQAVEVQFSLDEKSGETITRVGTTTDGVTEVQIPNELLKREGCKGDYFIYAYIFVSDEKSGNTKYKIAIAVKKRPKPEEPTGEPEQEENLFHATVVAVNAAADRAEKALGDVEEIRDNLNFDLSEKITRPQTAEVGQILAVKEIDESGKPTVFEAEDVKVPKKTSELENDSGFLTEHQDISGKLDKDKLPEAIDDALAQAKENGEFNGKDGAPGEKGDPGETTYVENPYDDTEIKKEIAAKVGYSEVVGNQLLMYADDTKEKLLATLELPSGMEDVQIDGTSIVENGIAEIPKATEGNAAGVVMIDTFATTGGIQRANTTTGLIRVFPARKTEINNRSNPCLPITATTLDYAVKAAMTDGKGDAWTDEEQAAARERMGIDEWELVADIALEEKVRTISFTIENWKELFVRIDAKAVQDTVSTTVLYPFDNSSFCDFYPETGKDVFIYVHMVKFDDYAFYEMSFNNKSGKSGTPKSSIVKCSTNRLWFERDYFESGTTAKIWIMR